MVKLFFIKIIEMSRWQEYNEVFFPNSEKMFAVWKIDSKALDRSAIRSPFLSKYKILPIPLIIGSNSNAGTYITGNVLTEIIIKYNICIIHLLYNFLNIFQN